jgi:hypothetical protein
MEKDAHETPDGREKNIERELQKDCSGRSSNHDQGSRWLHDLADVSTLHHHANENADESECKTSNAGDIHLDVPAYSVELARTV